MTNSHFWCNFLFSSTIHWNFTRSKQFSHMYQIWCYNQSWTINTNQQFSWVWALRDCFFPIVINIRIISWLKRVWLDTIIDLNFGRNFCMQKIIIINVNAEHKSKLNWRVHDGTQNINSETPVKKRFIFAAGQNQVEINIFFNRFHM